MTPERRAELLKEKDEVYRRLPLSWDPWTRGELVARRDDIIRELDEADDPEPESGSTLGLEER